MAAFYREHGRVVFAQVLLVAGERVLAEEMRLIRETRRLPGHVWPSEPGADRPQVRERRPEQRAAQVRRTG
jgi:hypothetical protein